jgi:hypothetical protein
MSKVPHWAQGAIFAVTLVILIFILKITCPLDIGCFADPFLIPLFSPLLIFEKLFGGLGSYEPFSIIIFWTVIGGIFGLLFGKLKKDISLKPPTES